MFFCARCDHSFIMGTGDGPWAGVSGRWYARVWRGDGRGGRLPLARGGHHASRGVFGRRLRLRGDASGGLFRGTHDLRRVAHDHAGISGVRDLLLPAPPRVVRPLQVFQALRPERHPDPVAQLGAALHHAHVRLSPEVPVYPADERAVRLRRDRDDRAIPNPALDGHLRGRLRRRTCSCS